ELPKARQFLRSGVFYTPVLVNGLADSLLQIRCLLNMRGEFPEARILLGSFVKVSPEETKRGKNPPDLHQLRTIDHRIGRPRPIQDRPDIEHVVQRQGVIEPKHQLQLPYPFELREDVLQLP